MATNSYLQPFFDTLAQGTQVAEHLRQAAMQQQQLEEARREFSATQALKQQEFDAGQQQSLSQALENGAKPVDANGNVSVNAPEGTWQRGTDGTLQQTLTTGPAVSLPADNGQTVNLGGRTLQVPTLQDRIQAEVDQQNAIERQTMPTAGQIFGSELAPGADPNVPVPNAGQVLAGRAYAQGMRGQQPPQPKYKYEDFRDNDSGIVTRVISDDQGNEIRRINLGKLVGEKAPAGADGAAARQITPDAVLATRNKALVDYQKASKEESDLEQQSLALGTALKSGQHYVDKNGNLKKFDPAATDDEKAAQQDDMRNRLGIVQKRIMQVIADKNDAMQRYGTKPQVSTEQAQARIRSGMAPSPQTAVAAPQKTPAAGPQQAPPPAALKLLKPGVVTTFRNGQKWTLDGSGQPQQVGS